MTVAVDEPGCQNEACCIDHCFTRAWRQGTDFGDTIAIDPDVRHDAAAARAIDHECVLNQRTRRLFDLPRARAQETECHQQWRAR